MFVTPAFPPRSTVVRLVRPAIGVKSVMELLSIMRLVRLVQYCNPCKLVTPALFTVSPKGESRAFKSATVIVVGTLIPWAINSALTDE